MFTAFDAAADMHVTRDGFLVARPRVARSGVEPFTAAEIERYAGRRFDRDVRVYTPPEELFDPRHHAQPCQLPHHARPSAPED
jgi:hypothetical protein